MDKPESQSLLNSQHLHQHYKLHFASTLCLYVSWTYKELCLDAWQKQDNFLFSKPYRPIMGPTQGLIHCPLSQAVNRPQREGDDLRYPHNYFYKFILNITSYLVESKTRWLRCPLFGIPGKNRQNPTTILVFLLNVM
jgi:hypothetical protein